MDLCELWQPPIVKQAALIEKVKYYLFQGLSYDEIGQRAEISHGTVCSIINHRIPDIAKEFRKKQKEQKKGKQKCMKCRYSAKLNNGKDSYITCDYFLTTGHRRPCKPGLDCTVMEPRKRGRKKKGAH